MAISKQVWEHYVCRLIFSSIFAIVMVSCFIIFNGTKSASFLATVLVTVHAVIFGFAFFHYRQKIERHTSSEQAKLMITTLEGWLIYKLFYWWSHHLIGVMITGLLGLYLVEFYKVSDVDLFKAFLIIAVLGDAIVPFREIRILKKIAG